MSYTHRPSHSIFTRVIVAPDGTAVCPGIDMGGKATVHHRDRFHLVLKVAGNTAWAGVGSRAYYGARFIVLGIDRVAGSATYMGVTGEQLATFDVVSFPLRPEQKPTKTRR